MIRASPFGAPAGTKKLVTRLPEQSLVDANVYVIGTKSGSEN